VASTFVGAFDSTAPEFGVVSGVNFTGPLILTSELKSAFQSKKPFGTPVLDTDHMYVYHSNANNNYVCFTPKASANRTGAIGPTLKCLSALGANATLGGQVGQQDNLNPNCKIPNPWVNTISATNANLMCVPEGAVQ
jgi:hypothetical protein